MPGILAGAAIVFVFALGYYITPTLVGGPGDQMISSYIAFYTNTTLNWGLAAALSVQLLLILLLAALLFWTVRALTRRRGALALRPRPSAARRCMPMRRCCSPSSWCRC